MNTRREAIQRIGASIAVLDAVGAPLLSKPADAELPAGAPIPAEKPVGSALPEIRIGIIGNPVHKVAWTDESVAKLKAIGFNEVQLNIAWGITSL